MGVALYRVGLILSLMDNVRIDTREKGRIESAKEYYKAHGLDVIVRRLDFGDYVFDDRVCFEFKTWEDFLSSMGNKSLFEEV